VVFSVTSFLQKIAITDTSWWLLASCVRDAEVCACQNDTEAQKLLQTSHFEQDRRGTES